MFSLTAPTSEPILHKDYLHFGSHFVLVLNGPEFLRRIHKAMVDLGLRGRCGWVEYYNDAKYSGKIGPFRKPERFAYQKEFRIIAEPGIAPFRDLVIGNLSDITTPILRLMELDRLVDFSEKTALACGWLKVETP